MAKDLAELQDEVIVRGYTHDFSFEGKSLRANETGKSLSLRELRVVESVTLDGGGVAAIGPPLTDVVPAASNYASSSLWFQSATLRRR